MNGMRTSQLWRSVVPGLRRARPGRSQIAAKAHSTRLPAFGRPLPGLARHGAPVAASAWARSAPAEAPARPMREVQSWDEFIERLNAGLTGHANHYAAVRKLSELTRRSMPEYRALSDDAKRLLTNGIDKALNGMDNDVKLLGIHEQQILLLEVSQLSAVFTGVDFRAHCPVVPTDLLNKLLDSIISGIRSLKGSQVGMVLFSLHKMQLRDPRAYAHVCDCIIDQLDSPGRNSWYRNTDALSKIISGVIMVSTSVPRNIRDDYLDAIITSTLSMMAQLDKAQFEASQTPWQDLCMAVEAVTRLPPSHGHVYAPFVKPLLDSFAAEAPEVPIWSLSQALRASALPGVQHAATVQLINQRVAAMSDQDLKSDASGLLLDLVQAHSRLPGEQHATAIHDLMQRAVAIAVPSKVLAQMCVHAQHANCLTSDVWAAVLAGEPWTLPQSRGRCPGADADAPEASVAELKPGAQRVADVPFNTEPLKEMEDDCFPKWSEWPYSGALDHECEAVLRVAIARRNAAVAKQAIWLALGWTNYNKIKLWRLVPYMEVLATVPENSGAVLSDAPMRGSLPDSTAMSPSSKRISDWREHPAGLPLNDLMQMAFEAFVAKIPVLADPVVFVQNRAIEVCHAIAACAKLGRFHDVENLIANQGCEMWFQDIGGRDAAMMHVLSILADDHFNREELEVSSSNIQAVRKVWNNALDENDRIGIHIGHRYTICAALTLCRYTVPPSEWVFRVATHLNARSPTTHLEMLQAVVQSRWFLTEANDDQKSALENILPGDVGRPSVQPASPAEGQLEADLPVTGYLADELEDELEDFDELEDELEATSASDEDLIEDSLAAPASEPAPVLEPVAVPEPAAEAAAMEPETAAGGYDTMTIPDLKDELRLRNLKVSGKKADLVKRLEADDQDSAASAASASEDDAAMMQPAMIDPQSSLSSDEKLAEALEELPPSIADDLADVTKANGSPLSVGDAEMLEDTLNRSDDNLSGGESALEDEVSDGESAAEEPESYPDEEVFGVMKVPELKDLLKKNGLKVGGKKQELVDRLLEAGVAAPRVVMS